MRTYVVISPAMAFVLLAAACSETTQPQAITGPTMGGDSSAAMLYVDGPNTCPHDQPQNFRVIGGHEAAKPDFSPVPGARQYDFEVWEVDRVTGERRQHTGTFRIVHGDRVTLPRGKYQGRVRTHVCHLEESIWTLWTEFDAGDVDSAPSCEHPYYDQDHQLRCGDSEKEY